MAQPEKFTDHVRSTWPAGTTRPGGHTGQRASPPHRAMRGALSVECCPSPASGEGSQELTFITCPRGAALSYVLLAHL